MGSISNAMYLATRDFNTMYVISIKKKTKKTETLALLITKAKSYSVALSVKFCVFATTNFAKFKIPKNGSPSRRALSCKDSCN